jgi:Histidine kinase-, DNA gyrase B-, and HSP90-like ATPase
MSSVDHAHRGGFLTELIRGGAPVIAEVPAELPAQAVDPAPLPGWRRISMMAGGTGSGVRDSLLVRACRYVVLVPLAYRVVAIPVQLLSVLAANHGAGFAQAAALAAVTVIVNVVALVWVLRVRGFHSTVAQVLLTADLVVGFGVNLAASLLVPDPGWGEVNEMTWVYLVGSVALLTLARGAPAGLALVVVCVPFRILVGMVGHHGGIGSTPVASAVDDLVTLVPALVVALAVLMLVGLGARLAMGVGLRRGRDAEAARSQRLTHDTVLQTLEAMALRPPTDPRDLRSALVQLDELRCIARSQAMELRRGLSESADESDPATPAGLGGELAAVAAEMAREGLRARLVFSELDDETLPETRRTAVRDAVREAMRNTMKHAGTTEVVLRVEQRDGGIAVIARDHGTGFSEADRPAGFGISNSITARLAEVGGTSTVESEPGRGTRVTLWVPL